VHNIDLDVRPGEIHALVGLNGAGKSTLMKLMIGMLRPDSGVLKLLGQDSRTMNGDLWARVGALIEYPLAYGELDGAANLRLAARLHGVRPVAIPGVVEAVIEELNLGRFAAVRARRMSLGNKQRLGLAAALQHHPDLIVLDEPTNALDPSGVILLREALLRRAAAGSGVLVSSHHLDEVARIASRISVIADGRMIGTLDPDGVDIERSFFSLVHNAELVRDMELVRDAELVRDGELVRDAELVRNAGASAR
jgi:ABC-2 type transport system ATP-binding protein